MIEQRLDKIDHPDIWRGVIADNVKTLKVLEAKRLGSGEWVAVVEIMKWNETESEANSIKCWHEKYPTRGAALDGARRLTINHASEIAPSTSLEAQVVSALDWVDDVPKDDEAGSDIVFLTWGSI